MLINLKDKVTQKFKFLLTLTQMEVLQSTKYVCRFTTKQCWSILLNNWSRWGLVCFEVLKWKKKKDNWKKHRIAPFSSCSIIQAPALHIGLKSCYAPTSDGVCANAFSWVATVKISGCEQCCFKSFGDLWDSKYLGHAVPSHRLLQLFKRMLQHCFDVTLQKCFADGETSPNFPSAWQ